MLVEGDGQERGDQFAGTGAKREGEKERRSGHGEDGDDPNIVCFEENDPAFPQNWSLSKRLFVTTELCLFTSSVVRLLELCF